MPQDEKSAAFSLFVKIMDFIGLEEPLLEQQTPVEQYVSIDDEYKIQQAEDAVTELIQESNNLSLSVILNRHHKKRFTNVEFSDENLTPDQRRITNCISDYFSSNFYFWENYDSRLPKSVLVDIERFDISPVKMFQPFRRNGNVSTPPCIFLTSL